MPVPTLREYFDRWQVQHNAPDLDPGSTTLLRLFLTFTYVCAKPFAKHRVSPNVITFLGLGVAGLVVPCADRWPIAAAFLIFLSTLTDGVDGCVAALNDCATRFGFVLDSVVDRFADGLFLYALVRAGGATGLAVGAGCATVALEYTRARAGAAGFGEVGIVTIGERPTRAVAAILGLVGAQALSTKPWVGPNIALAVTLIAGAFGSLQLFRHLWRNPD